MNIFSEEIKVLVVNIKVVGSMVRYRVCLGVGRKCEGIGDFLVVFSRIIGFLGMFIVFF